MAGSVKWFQYADGNGVLHAVKVDKSNASVLGFAELSSPLIVPLPRGYRMRKVNCIATTGEGKGWYRRSFACGTPTATAFTSNAPFAINGITWQPVSTTGERQVRPSTLDTGLTDG